MASGDETVPGAKEGLHISDQSSSTSRGLPTAGELEETMPSPQILRTTLDQLLAFYDGGPNIRIARRKHHQLELTFGLIAHTVAAA